MKKEQQEEIVEIEEAESLKLPDPEDSKGVNNQVVSVRQQVIDLLYGQKKFARHFGIYIGNLWALLPQLTQEQKNKLEEKIGKERLEDIKNGIIKVTELQSSDNIALLEIIPEEQREIVYQQTKLPNRTQEFYKRKAYELHEFTRLIEVEDDQIVDIAGGAGDVGRVLSSITGKPAVVLDADPKQIRFVEELNSILGQNITGRRFDIRNEKIPEGTWVAKHPCGDLADNIIQQWSQNEGTKALYIMTCCQGMAKEYPNPYGFSKEEWKSLCKKSDLTNSQDPTKRKEGQEAMDRLDSARVDYLERKGFKAKLTHIPGTIKGNVIVAKKE